MYKLSQLLDGKKTYIISFTMIAYAVVIEGWQNHNWQPATTLILQGSGLGALRAAVAKV